MRHHSSCQTRGNDVDCIPLSVGLLREQVNDYYDPNMILERRRSTDNRCPPKLVFPFRGKWRCSVFWQGTTKEGG